MSESKRATCFEAEVVDVYSGDDLIVMVDLGIENLFKKQRVRLQGVDTPNAIGSGANTPAGAVRAYVRNLCRGKKIKLEVTSRSLSSWVAVVHVVLDSGLHNLNEDLIAQGYVYKRET